MKSAKALLRIALASSLAIGAGIAVTGCSSAQANQPSSTTAADPTTVLPILDRWEKVSEKSVNQMLDTGVVETYQYPGETYTFVLDPTAQGDSTAGMLKQPGDEYTVVPDTTYFLVILAGQFVTQSYTIDYEGTPTPNDFTVRVANMEQVEPPMFIDVVDGLMTAVRGGEGETAFTGTIKYTLTDTDREVVTKALAAEY